MPKPGPAHIVLIVLIVPIFIDVFHGFYRTAIVPTFIDVVPFLINIVPTYNLFLFRRSQTK